MASSVTSPGPVRPGDLFESPRHHPCLCYAVGGPGDAEAVFGISLVDGSTCRCSEAPCGFRLLTPEEAWRWESEGPPGVHLPEESRWW
jgi:hypothetical protein